jgi:hypothetical protein
MASSGRPALGCATVVASAPIDTSAQLAVCHLPGVMLSYPVC